MKASTPMLAAHHCQVSASSVHLLLAFTNLGFGLGPVIKSPALQLSRLSDHSHGICPPKLEGFLSNGLSNSQAVVTQNAFKLELTRSWYANLSRRFLERNNQYREPLREVRSVRLAAETRKVKRSHHLQPYSRTSAHLLSLNIRC